MTSHRVVGCIVLLGLCACENQKQFSLTPQEVAIIPEVQEAIPVTPPEETLPTPQKPEENPVGADTLNTVTEVYTQKLIKNKVDILIVSDNSTSMYEDQKKLGKRFDSFTSALSDIDWQIGVTTTDVTHGPYGLQGSLIEVSDNHDKYITDSSPNAETLFKNTVVRQETITCEKNNTACPSSVEEPLNAIRMAIEKRNTTNQGFFRDQSTFVALVISDEDEKERRPKDATKPSEVIAEFRRAFGPEKDIKGYGIIIKPGDTNCYKSQHSQFATIIGGGQGGATYGTAVADFSSLTGGTLGSICDDDYTVMLKQISQHIHKSVSTFQLSQTPKEGSVHLTFIPAENKVNYELSGDKVIFALAPPIGTEVKVTYTPK